MCLIVFAYNCHPVYRLILGANRDEFRDRPTDPSRFWSDAPHLLAGRDKVAGGTWLGVTKAGKVAAITNYRDPRRHVSGFPSRGNLVAGFLKDPLMTPAEFQGVLNRDGERYNGFNLLYGNSTTSPTGAAHPARSRRASTPCPTICSIPAGPRRPPPGPGSKPSCRRPT